MFCRILANSLSASHAPMDGNPLALYRAYQRLHAGSGNRHLAVAGCRLSLRKVVDHGARSELCRLIFYLPRIPLSSRLPGRSDWNDLSNYAISPRPPLYLSLCFGRKILGLSLGPVHRVYRCRRASRNSAVWDGVLHPPTPLACVDGLSRPAS